MKKDISVNWYNKDNRELLKTSNLVIYKEISVKGRQLFNDNKSNNYYNDLLNNFMCYKKTSQVDQLSVTYKIMSNPKNLTNDEIALILDFGSLAFGYEVDGDYFTIFDQIQEIKNDNFNNKDQIIKDIKKLLLWEWAKYDETCDSSIWKSNDEFIEIANRYNITKENIFENIDEGLKEEYEDLLLPIEMRFND